MNKCKACGDVLNPKAPWRKDAPPSNSVNKADYCRDCYYELATGEVPNVISSTVAHGSGGLTYRQAVKKN